MKLNWTNICKIATEKNIDYDEAIKIILKTKIKYWLMILGGLMLFILLILSQTIWFGIWK